MTIEIDYLSLSHFLTFWLEADGTLPIRAFIDKNHPNYGALPVITKFINPRLDPTFALIRTLQNKGYGIHTPLCTLNRYFKSDNNTKMRGFFVDVDDIPNWYENLQKLEMQPTFIVQHYEQFNPQGRCHLYWLFEEWQRMDGWEWEAYQEALAAAVGSKTPKELAHIHHLLRLPYTYHLKDNKPSMLRILGGTFEKYDSTLLTQYLEKATDFKERKYKIPAKVDKVPTTLALSPEQEKSALLSFETYLEDQTPPSSDGVKQALYVVSCKAKERGVPIKMVTNLLVEWACSGGRYGETPGRFITDELRKTIRDAYKYSQNQFAAKALPHISFNKEALGQLDQGKNGAIKATLSNMQTIIENHPFFSDLFAYNLFTHNIEVVKSTKNVYPRHEGDKNLQEIDIAKIRTFCSRVLKVEMSQSTVETVILEQAYKYSFHPIKQYLDSLTWDGVPRIKDWLFDYCFADGRQSEEEPFVQWAAMSFLVAAVARIYVPGTKYDHILVLQGNEGLRKSTVFNVLASDAYYQESSFNIRMNENKDYLEGLDTSWIVEIGEMANMFKVDQENLKQFISRRKSHYRKSYARRGATYPRQYVLGTTTNRSQYLISMEGNRRFLPILCLKPSDTTALLKDRDQLWAEAVMHYKSGFKLAMPDSIVDTAKDVTESRHVGDGWMEPVIYYIDNVAKGKPFSIHDVFTNSLGINGHSKELDRSKQLRISSILKDLGYAPNCRKRDKNGNLRNFWQKNEN